MKYRVGYTEYFSEDYRKFQHDVIIVGASSPVKAMNKAQKLLKGRHVVLGNIAEPLLEERSKKGQ